MNTPVYDRYALAPGAQLTGPAIVEERESTAVIGPGGRCRIDDGLALVVHLLSLAALFLLLGSGGAFLTLEARSHAEARGGQKRRRRDHRCG